MSQKRRVAQHQSHGKPEYHSSQVSEDSCARNVRNVANRCVFSMIRASWCSKSRLGKAAGAEGAAEKRYEKLHAAVARSTCVRQTVRNTAASEPFCKSRSGKNSTPLWREAHFQLKMHKTPQSRSHFASLDPEKWHAAVAPSAFSTQNVQNTSLSEPFSELRSGRMARRCGAKRIFHSQAHFQLKMLKNWRVRTAFWMFDVEKLHAAVAPSTFFNSKCTKHLIVGAIFGVAIRKNGTPLWRQAHFQLKMYKTPVFGSILKD